MNRRRRRIFFIILNEMSSTLLCIGHPLHGETGCFSLTLKICCVIFFSLFFSFSLFLSPHSNRTLIHHFHSWFSVCMHVDVCMCALGLFTKIFILYDIPSFFAMTFYKILFNIHLFNHVFFFSFAIQRMGSTLCCYIHTRIVRCTPPLLPFLLVWCLSFHLPFFFWKKEPKKNWKNSLASVICVVEKERESKWKSNRVSTQKVKYHVNNIAKGKSI